MSRFARIGEEAFSRHQELTGEEFRLYAIIVYHTWIDAGICRNNLRQLAKMYSLSYSHTTERYKILLMDFDNLPDDEKRKRQQKIKSPWCEDTTKGIRPLVGIKVPKTGTFENEMFRKPEHDSSENRNIDIPKTGTFEDEMFQKSEHVFKGIIEPFKDQNFLETTTTEKEVVVVGNTNGHKSQFSIEECLRYAAICEDEGQDVKNRFGLASYLFESGEKDSLILAKLYPEKTETVLPATAAGEISETRLEGLNFLTDMIADNLDISGMKQFYSSEDWEWLQQQLNNR